MLVVEVGERVRQGRGFLFEQWRLETVEWVFVGVQWLLRTGWKGPQQVVLQRQREGGGCGEY